MSRIDAVLPPLPEPAYFIAEDSKRHGMYPCYRHAQTLQKYGGEGVFEFGFTAEQMRAYALQSFKQGRQQGMKQERALWMLARSSEEIEPLVHPDGKSLVPSSAETVNTVGADAPPTSERSSADWRRLTGLWRYGVNVLPPTCQDFYNWLGILDAAIDERTTRRPT